MCLCSCFHLSPTNPIPPSLPITCSQYLCTCIVMKLTVTMPCIRLAYNKNAAVLLNTRCIHTTVQHLPHTPVSQHSPNSVSSSSTIGFRTDECCICDGGCSSAFPIGSLRTARELVKQPLTLYLHAQYT